MAKPQLHLFDFDGTITRRDSLLDFGSYAVGPFRSKLYLALVTPLIILMKWGIISNGNAKVRFLKLHFNGKTRSEMNALAVSYFQHSIKSDLIWPKAALRLNDLQKAGHTICIVSASLDVWLQPFAKHFGANLICTKAAFNGNIFNGDIDGPNCNFGRKAKLVKAAYNFEDYSKVVAYGDSSGDKALLSVADEGLMRPFENQPSTQK